MASGASKARPTTRPHFDKLSANGVGTSGGSVKTRGPHARSHMPIRIATPADAETIAAAEAETQRATPGLLIARPGEISVEAYREKIAKLATEGRYIVAEEAGTPVGHAFLDPMPMRANAHVFLLTIVVHPGHVERGIGTAMLRDLLDWARCDPRVGKIELNVRAGNLRARNLYRRFGFREQARFVRRVQHVDGQFEDDVGMAWFPDRVERDDGRTLD
jgi:RimJ/RimL family protein N-acetyltransferase